ncbi:hypothetical protein BRPE64_CCDS02060 [Caballeronia insecticola]|uniref:Uncharacterized protein n=1 Tax=Caballeronia insecticola TaxID=758793 RepID=R4WP11_9BURK|nr:hypothetical protein BRPE64_CCDS02060 [Caballeronia insecticola]
MRHAVGARESAHSSNLHAETRTDVRRPATARGVKSLGGSRRFVSAGPSFVLADAPARTSG